MNVSSNLKRGMVRNVCLTACRRMVPIRVGLLVPHFLRFQSSPNHRCLNFREEGVLGSDRDTGAFSNVDVPIQTCSTDSSVFVLVEQLGKGEATYSTESCLFVSH